MVLAKYLFNFQIIQSAVKPMLMYVKTRVKYLEAITQKPKITHGWHEFTMMKVGILKTICM